VRAQVRQKPFGDPIVQKSRVRPGNAKPPPMRRALRITAAGTRSTGSLSFASLNLSGSCLSFSRDQAAGARGRGARNAGGSALGTARQRPGARRLERHHSASPQRVHLLGRGRQAGSHSGAPHQADPGGTGGRAAQAVLLAGMQTSRATAPATRHRLGVTAEQCYPAAYPRCQYHPPAAWVNAV
jgi:hypothetical protein